MNKIILSTCISLLLVSTSSANTCDISVTVNNQSRYNFVIESTESISLDNSEIPANGSTKGKLENLHYVNPKFALGLAVSDVHTPDDKLVIMFQGKATTGIDILCWLSDMRVSYSPTTPSDVVATISPSSGSGSSITMTIENK